MSDNPTERFWCHKMPEGGWRLVSNPGRGNSWFRWWMEDRPSAPQITAAWVDEADHIKSKEGGPVYLDGDVFFGFDVGAESVTGVRAVRTADGRWTITDVAERPAINPCSDIPKP